jgi:hypothetical protein
MQHRGQLGLVEALEHLGDSVTRAFTHAEIITDYDYAIAPIWWGDLEAVLQKTQGRVIPAAPPVDVWWHPDFLIGVRDRVPFVLGVVASPPTEAAYREIGIPYRYLPFGTSLRPSPKTPGTPQEEYRWGFVGNAVHRENWREYIGRLVEKSRQDGVTPFALVGVGWEPLGVAWQLMDWSEAIARIYANAWVCPNFHGPEQKRPGVREDCNQRLFDLAGLGCLQVVDRFPLLDSYFNDDEVVKANTPEEWVDKVLWYAQHPFDGLSFREKAARRVQAEHTWQHRARQLRRWADGSEG